MLHFRAIPGHPIPGFKNLQEVQYLDSFRDLQTASTTASGHQKQEIFSLQSSVWKVTCPWECTFQPYHTARDHPLLPQLRHSSAQHRHWGTTVWKGCQAYWRHFLLKIKSITRLIRRQRLKHYFHKSFILLIRFQVD